MTFTLMAWIDLRRDRVLSLIQRAKICMQLRTSILDRAQR